MNFPKQPAKNAAGNTRIDKFCHGATGTRRPDGRCSSCGASGFAYSNGQECSADGVRGYRCMTCGTIKPETIHHP